MIKTERTEYNDSENTYEGFVAYDTEITGKKPVVLIAHAFSGLTELEEEKAIELAKAGYIGFAADIYGKGKRAKTREESRELMSPLAADRKLLLSRMKTSLEYARKLEGADTGKIGAIGFCFGGKCILDLARSGENLSGIVTFHGSYDKPGYQYDTKIKAPALILHGWNDPFSKPEHLLALAEELSEADVPWEINMYSHTYHAFTNPAMNSPETGAAYNKESSEKAWARMKDFFAKVFDN